MLGRIVKISNITGTRNKKLYMFINLFTFYCFCRQISGLKNGKRGKNRSMNNLATLNTQTFVKSTLFYSQQRTFGSSTPVAVGYRGCLFYLFHTQSCACDLLKWQPLCCFIFSLSQDFDISFVCLILCHMAKSFLHKPTKKIPKGCSTDFFASQGFGADVRVCVCGCVRCNCWMCRGRKKKSQIYLKWGLNDESVRVRLVKSGRNRPEWARFVLSLLSECTADSSSERFHKPQIQYSADPTYSAEARPHFLLT